MTALLANAINRHVTQDYEREERDWYVEPAWCWDVLHVAAPWLFEGSVLDPACGGGTGVEWCRAHGVWVRGSDLVDRGAGDAHGLDFLAPDYPFTSDAVITNPPYRHTVDFIHRALSIARVGVAVLVPLPTLCSQKRFHLFMGTPVHSVVVLSKRPSMPPGGQGIKATGGKEDYCWIIWRHGYEGAPCIHWAMP